MAVYQEYRVFEKPQDKNATIWRYMTFTKFMALMETQSLYFTVVAELEDKGEGQLPLETLNSLYHRIAEGYENTRRVTAVNCWHLKEDETAAMWKVYSMNTEGIAIRSTFARLAQSFCDIKGTETYGEPIFIGLAACRTKVQATGDQSQIGRILDQVPRNAVRNRSGAF